MHNRVGIIKSTGKYRVCADSFTYIGPNTPNANVCSYASRYMPRSDIWMQQIKSLCVSFNNAWHYLRFRLPTYAFNLVGDDNTVAATRISNVEIEHFHIRMRFT